MDSILKYYLVVLMIGFVSCATKEKTFDFEKYQADIEAYDLNEIDSKPEVKGGFMELLNGIEYPEEARKEGIEGRVVIGFIVDKNGDLYNFEVLESAGHSLDQEAQRMVSNTPFISTMKNNEPVNVHFQAPVLFRLP